MKKKSRVFFLSLFFVFLILIGVKIWDGGCDEASQSKGKEGSVVMKAQTYSNRLIKEKSPYLLQHAHNPVDWYPWGSEAFQKARKEDKPIFLSVGYSTCHWCHVMEEESFENLEIANFLNEHFVAIKVDREERPDVDQIYMTTVQAMTGAGGWPMSVFLTQDLKPFYGGTYFPPEDRWGRPGFLTVLKTIAEKWKDDRAKLLRSAEAVTRAIASETMKGEGEKKELTQETLEKAFLQFVSQFDSEYGGFGGAPKFPRSHTLSYLLRYWKRTGNPKALEMVEKTLSEMAKGGVYDHLGGGFHRYSVDGQWRVPHFEKMLYDQAILSKAYLEAYQATKNEEYARIAGEIFEYVLRDMTDSAGGFYSAEDADSASDPSSPEEKSEGAFYLWAEDEIVKLLGKERAQVFNYYYGVESVGNALSDPQGEFAGKNVLYISRTLDQVAERFGKNVKEVQKLMDEGKEILFTARSSRPRPHLDDKVLTDWNGLMISSLAFGSKVLNEPRYAEAARKAADFILAKMKRDDGRLMHRYRDGEVAIMGFSEDHAFFIHGLFDLYEATFAPRYLEEAKFFSKEMFHLFWDEEGGGFFLAGNDAEKLISRSKELYDGAIPSGNSVATLSLLRVSRLIMDKEMESRARRTLDEFSEALAQFPSGYPQMLIALDFAIGPAREIVIAGDSQDPAAQSMIREIFAAFIPNKVVAFHSADQEQAKKMTVLIPFMKEQGPVDGKVTVYVCKNYVCQLPVTEFQKLRKLLSE